MILKLYGFQKNLSIYFVTNLGGGRVPKDNKRFHGGWRWGVKSSSKREYVSDLHLFCLEFTKYNLIKKRVFLIIILAI